MLIGYARVSTEDQNLDVQRDALKAAGCTRIFEEKESGRAGTKRPALEAALDFLRAEDQLVVWKVDRLGRSLREMLDTALLLQERGVKLRSLTEQVDTETATERMMFNFLGTITEYFLDLNRERTLAGLRHQRRALATPRSSTAAEVAESTETPAEMRTTRWIALLVDDEELVRMSTADMLGELGYAVVEAASGEEAMRLVDRGAHFDLLVTDHLMPGLTGTDLARGPEEPSRRAGAPCLGLRGERRGRGRLAAAHQAVPQG